MAVTPETFLKRSFVTSDLTDDDDWSDPSQAGPGADRRIALGWFLAGPTLKSVQAPKLKLGVTFRDGDGVEIIGTFAMTVYQEEPAEVSASDSHAAARSSWKKIGTWAGQPSDTSVVLDVGGDGTLAVRLHDMTAVGATYATCNVQQWGAD